MKRIRFRPILCVLLVLLFLLPGCSDGASTEETRQVAILMYHDFTAEGEAGDYTVSAAVFEDHLRALKEAGYTAVTFQDLADFVLRNGSLPERPVVISSDDGYTGVLTVAQPLCQRYGMVMSCAIIGSRIHADSHFVPGDNVPKGLEITSHTYDLHKTTDGAEGLNLPYQKDDKYRALLTDDVTAMKQEFAEAFPEVATILVYPHGAYSDTSDALLRDLGYEVTVSVDHGIAEITRGDAQSLMHLPRLGVYETMDGRALLFAIHRAAH